MERWRGRVAFPSLPLGALPTPPSSGAAEASGTQGTALQRKYRFSGPPRAPRLLRLPMARRKRLSFYLQIHETIESINQLKIQRDFMLSFSRDPKGYIQDLLRSQSRDLKVKGPRGTLDGTQAHVTQGPEGPGSGLTPLLPPR